MRALFLGLTAFIAVEHVWFLVMEMFLWNKPTGRKAFGTTQAFADETRVLAANQGLYNGFLAAGLLASFLLASPEEARHARLFFLGCVGVAGLFGGATASWRIYVIQAFPAGIALGIALAFGL